MRKNNAGSVGHSAVCGFGVAMLVMVAMMGCNQSQSASPTQAPRQVQTAPQVGDTMSKTAGPVINIIIGNEMPASAEMAFATNGTVPKASAGSATSLPNAKPTAQPAPPSEPRLLADRSPRNVRSTLTINIGNQTPTATNTLSGTNDGSQTPSQNPTASSVPTASPEFRTQIPVNFGMPGSAVSGGSTSAADNGGQTGQQTSTASQSPQTAFIRGASQYLAPIVDSLGQWWSRVVPAAVPATPAVPTGQ